MPLTAEQQYVLDELKKRMESGEVNYFIIAMGKDHEVFCVNNGSSSILGNMFIQACNIEPKYPKNVLTAEQLNVLTEVTKRMESGHESYLICCSDPDVGVTFHLKGNPALLVENLVYACTVEPKLIPFFKSIVKLAEGSPTHGPGGPAPP